MVGAEEIKKQAAEGAVVGGVDFTGATALHLAAVYGHDEAAAVLLEAGAQPNLADRQAGLLTHLRCLEDQLKESRERQAGAQVNSTTHARNFRHSSTGIPRALVSFDHQL